MVDAVPVGLTRHPMRPQIRILVDYSFTLTNQVRPEQTDRFDQLRSLQAVV